MTDAADLIRQARQARLGLVTDQPERPQNGPLARKSGKRRPTAPRVMWRVYRPTADGLEHEDYNTKGEALEQAGPADAVTRIEGAK